MANVIRIYTPLQRDFVRGFWDYDYFIKDGDRLELCCLNGDNDCKVTYVFPIVDGKIKAGSYTRYKGWTELDPNHTYYLMIDSYWKYDLKTFPEEKLMYSTFPEEFLEVIKADNIKSVGIGNDTEQDNPKRIAGELERKFKKVYLLGHYYGNEEMLDFMSQDEHFKDILSQKKRARRVIIVYTPTIGDFIKAFEANDYFIEDSWALKVCTFGADGKKKTYKIEMRNGKTKNSYEVEDGWTKFEQGKEYEYYLMVASSWNNDFGLDELIPSLKNERVKSVSVFSVNMDKDPNEAYKFLSEHIAKEKLSLIGNVPSLSYLFPSVIAQGLMKNVLSIVKTEKPRTIKEFRVFGVWTVKSNAEAKLVIESLRAQGVEVHVAPSWEESLALSYMAEKDQTQTILELANGESSASPEAKAPVKNIGTSPEEK